MDHAIACGRLRPLRRLALLLGLTAGLLGCGERTDTGRTAGKAPDTSVSGAAPAAAPAAGAAVKIDGSSTVYPVTEAVAEEFQRANRGLKVTVGVSGTGGGFKKFCRGETDISNASRPITADEMHACRAAGIEYFELPIAYDAITVVANPRNGWLTQITVEELKRLWEPQAQGQVTRWNQVNPRWPDEPVKLFGAGSDSGTFDYFTEAVVGKAKSSRGDYTASEDDNVLVQGVAGDLNAIGYFGYAYFAENQGRVKAVPIVAGQGMPAVAPSEQTVLDGTYRPLSRPIFIYVNAKSLGKPEVKQFVDFFITNAAKMAAEVKYVPLPADAYRTAAEHLAQGRKGTVFGGRNEVGITVAELLKREAKP